MTAEEISAAAWSGEAAKLETLCDKALYICLRDLYAAHRAGSVSTEEAKAEKERLVTRWQIWNEEIAYLHRVRAERQAAVRAAQGIYPEKAQSMAECIEMLAQIVAAQTGDSTLPDRLQRKWSETHGG